MTTLMSTVMNQTAQSCRREVTMLCLILVMNNYVSFLSKLLEYIEQHVRVFDLFLVVIR